jgi:L-ribulose-5-phosphate 4-epimerase
MIKKAVLFDLDDTLYDYSKVHKIAIKEVYKLLKEKLNLSYTKVKYLFKLSREEVHRELSGTASAHNRILYFQRLIEKTHEHVDSMFILKLYNTYWDTLLKNMELRPGVLKTLKKLKEEDLKIAIVSDLTTNIQIRKLHKLGISKYVDALVTSEETGSDKPHAIMFLLALNKLKVSPNEALMVGDNTIADIEGANFVGIDTVLLQKGALAKTFKEDYKQPNYTIKNIPELLKVIDKINLSFVQNEGYIKFKCIIKNKTPVSKNKIIDLNIYRNKLYKLKLIGAYSNKIGYGNISIRDKDKKFLISGTTTGNYAKLTNKHYSKVVSYKIKLNTLTCSGAIKASSESMTHANIYECNKNIGAVIHIHNNKLWKKHLYKLPTTPKYATFGTPELAYEIKKLYNNSKFKTKKIAILGGHVSGIIVFGKDLEEAYSIILKYFNKI